jgi:hypothetical protein
MTSAARTWIAGSAITVFLLAGVAFVRAQPAQGGPTSPLILSGNDIGFRIEGRRGSVVVGRFVVRVDGQWLDVREPLGVKPITEP